MHDRLTLNVPIATKVVCFFRLLKCLRSLYGKQCGPRSDCSYRSSLFWVHTVCFYTKFVSNVRQLCAADDFSRRHFQMHFFLGALRVNPYPVPKRMCGKQIEQTDGLTHVGPAQFRYQVFKKLLSLIISICIFFNLKEIL